MHYEGECFSIHEPFGNLAKGCLIFMLLVDESGLRSCDGKKADLRKTKGNKVLFSKWKEMERIQELDLSQGQINTFVGEWTNCSSSFNIARLHSVVVKRKGKGSFGRPRCRWENQIQTHLKETVLGSVECTRLHGNQCWACVNHAMNPRLRKIPGFLGGGGGQLSNCYLFKKDCAT